MRLLVVTNDYPPTVGGIQSYVRDFLATLDGSGVEVYVLASTQNAEEAAEYDQQLAANITAIRYPVRVMLPTLRLRKRMQSIITEYGIDTVWFPAAAPLAVLAPAARAAGASRVVASTHGHEVGWSMLPGARQVLRRIGRSVDTLSYISNYTRGRLDTAFGGPEWCALPSGVDLHTFRPLDKQDVLRVRAQHGLPPDAPLVTCVSRLVKRKGQDILIDVWPEIVRTHPDAQLLIIGEGPYGSNLSRRREASSAKSNIRLLGRRPFSDMVEILAASTVAAMPCRTRGKGLDVEGLGIVYLEAQACGIPAIAGKSGGAPETVDHGRTGFVVDGRDPRDVINRLRQLLDDPELRTQYGRAGREAMEDQWAWEQRAVTFRQFLHMPSDPRSSTK